MLILVRAPTSVAVALSPVCGAQEHYMCGAKEHYMCDAQEHYMCGAEAVVPKFQ